MAIGRMVPWSNWEEWGAVYRNLFSESQKNTALYQVSSVTNHARHLQTLTHLAGALIPDSFTCMQLAVWRCRGKVPLAVEITGSLVEVNIRSVCRCLALYQLVCGNCV